MDSSDRPTPAAVSVLISTRNRPHDLLGTVRSINVAADRCPDLPIEVVVVENGSTSENRLDPEELRRLGSERLTHVWMDQGNLAQARNRAMQEATGDLFVFTDDDCLAEPDFIADAVRHWRESPPLFVTGGRIKLANLLDLPLTIKDDPEPATYDGTTHPGGFVHGANFILSRATADRIGPFDTRFGAGARFRAGEDTDYLIRAHAAGIPIRYVPDMVVHHNHGRRDKSAIKDLFYGYSYANGALAAKHVRTDPRLMRHVYWDLRNMLKDLRKREFLDEDMGLTWASLALPQIAGVRDFTISHLLGRKN